ncbi:segregation/condensation protein A [Candidatus Pacearchaeota archaeon]|nr:segregation/condensation protein A [Candidatus Pacearchaeota archaeon]
MKRGNNLTAKPLIFREIVILESFPKYKSFVFPKLKTPNMKQEQIHDLLFKPEMRWQEIIYDLINTEELDPWDIDIAILADRYIEEVKDMDEGDFFVSSQVLLAAALLLRIKSEILLSDYIRSIDDILFGKEDYSKRILERIELDGEIPELVPRSPMSRFKKVTLNELLESLNKAITTENRRIKKEIIKKNAIRETALSLPKKRMFSIKDKIKEIHTKLRSHLSSEEKKKISYTDLIGKEREERILSFYPILQLENNSKVWLEQERHFHEIYVWLKHVYVKHNGDPMEEIRKELEEQMKEMDSKKRRRVKKVNKDFENPIGDMFE